MIGFGIGKKLFLNSRLSANQTRKMKKRTFIIMQQIAKTEMHLFFGNPKIRYETEFIKYFELFS